MSLIQACVAVEAALSSVKSQAAIINSQGLPDYDKGLSTRTFMIVGLAMSYGLGITSLVTGIYVLSNPEPAGMPIGLSEWIELSPMYERATILFFNLLIVLSTECIGYIHTVTLRWALAKEGRLHFNSNLRLFSAAHSSVANGSLVNFLSASLLIVCFAAASQIFVPVIDSEGIWICVNGVALVLLSIGLIGLATITTVGMARAEKSGLILSWNPNALNTTLACMHLGVLTRRTGRSIKSAAAANTITEPIIPIWRQPSARETRFLTSYFTRFLWFILFLTLILAVSLSISVFIVHQQNNFGALLWFSISYGEIDDGIYDALLVIPIPGSTTFVRLLIGFLWTAMLASFSTMALHAAEILVNLRRDESDWRKAISVKGASLESGAFAAAIGNKGSSFLFCFKPLVQWVWGLGIFVCINPGLDSCTIIVNPGPILILLVLVLILAIFASVCARISPKGYQPSTYGHLQTLADLIDEWGDGPTDKLFWGDKGIMLYKQDEGIVVRKAGTSNKKCEVADIISTTLYA